MSEEYFIKSRFWIATKEGTFLGDGKVKLLTAIAETGSISAAARSLEISYRKAWKMIDVMNEQAKSPLVERQSGGKRGGGTIVTPKGLHAIESFLVLKKKCQEFMDVEFNKLEF
jgi:molybdate transport system regulatory protein